MKFKVGDKVRVRADLTTGKGYGKDGVNATGDMVRLAGKIVTIIQSPYPDRYWVEGCYWNWVDEMFDSASNQKIVITTDGVETLARLYEGEKVIKSATAKCNPEDTFDFKVGAKLAYDRLMGEEKTESKSETKLDETFKFKVGDRVIVNDDLKTDEIGTIICIKADEKRYGVEFDRPGAGLHNCGGFSYRLLAGEEGTSGNCWWAATKSLRHYEEPKKETKAEETLKYNTGDYVRIIDEKHGHGFKIGTIVRLTKGCTDYKATDSTGDLWWVRDDELATIEWKVVNRDAKKGDYVRLLSSGGFDFSRAGDILVVHEVVSNERILVLGKDHPRDTHDDDNKWCYYRSEYEVIEPIKTSKKSDTKGYKFKVGDKIVGNDKADKRYSITRKGWRGIVTEVSSDGFRARATEGTCDFHLEYDYFEPYEELYNGKVVCVDLQGINAGSYTVGKIYQFKDGHFITDNGYQMPASRDIHNFEEWEKWTSSKFIEVKE